MSHRENPSFNDYALATMYRIDPERLAQIRRVVSGMTRCPECDALNRADQKFCEKCGVKLYPEVKDEDKKDEEPYVPPEKTSIPAPNATTMYHDAGIPEDLESEPLTEPETVPKGMTRCAECGELNKADQRYCGYCGMYLYSTENIEPRVPATRGRKRVVSSDNEKPPYY